MKALSALCEWKNEGHEKTKGLMRIGEMYFGSQSVAGEQRGNEKKMWLTVRPIVNLQIFTFFLLHTVYSIQLQLHNTLYSLTKTQRCGNGSPCNQ